MRWTAGITELFNWIRNHEIIGPPARYVFVFVIAVVFIYTMYEVIKSPEPKDGKNWSKCSTCKYEAPNVPLVIKVCWSYEATPLFRSKNLKKPACPEEFLMRRR